MMRDENSVTPCTKYLTFGSWVYMVPQYKPESVLMLGYAEGTTAGLIRLLYGDVPITGVDIEPCEPSYGVTPIQADAKEFVKTCGSFDTVIVDIFPNGTYHNCDFLIDREFVTNLARTANYVIVNTLKEPDMSVYDELMERVGKNSPSGLANVIHYYQTVKIPELRPYR